MCYTTIVLKGEHMQNIIDTGIAFFDSSYSTLYGLVQENREKFDADKYDTNHKYFVEFMNEEFEEVTNSLKEFKHKKIDMIKLSSLFDQYKAFINIALRDNDSRSAFDTLTMISEEIEFYLESFVLKTSVVLKPQQIVADLNTEYSWLYKNIYEYYNACFLQETKNEYITKRKSSENPDSSIFFRG